MNESAAPRRIALAVVNPQMLQQGCAPTHTFDSTGGTIGCRGANWILTDSRDRVHAIHCEILFEEGNFCVIDRSGHTRVNSNESPVGQNVSARLGEGDTLHVGPYRIVAHLQDQDHQLPDPSRHLSQYGVGEMLNDQGAQLDELANGPAAPDMRPERDKGRSALDDLVEGTQRDSALDPLAALDEAERRAKEQAEKRSSNPFDPTHYGLSPSTTQADLAETRFEAVSGIPLPHSGEPNMTQQYDYSTPAAPVIGGDPQQAIEPLLQGLGAPIGRLDGQSAHQLLLEAGQALNATIRGIAALYGSQAGTQQRLALLNRTLQPIEDNPLRLGQSYDDTVRALFSSDRSVVHLSPRAAIDESLAQARQHNTAIIQAISASLDALLRSFAPDVLLQRFQRYRPGHTAQSESNDWAWQMYTHYYNELTSSRQKGFEKLFWEVFEQAYDQALRAEAQ
ncbi:type VI secretion system-associated FHA domain protein TagH [Zestomonas carbonaria]|uniref:Type VI secretion system-associated FHA domain protein TagH n=1 Tax=Zestomonas carbonaria TaxID=2762745 RepID=A0A7U7IAG5_9GAMM|nr:type VI secretion system-associated FHA domain protein TagH [Pseudomonas carbonaria]CAD5109360.1 hypothetical protein PSEWESI4_03657 [Pseudomonas carbonaria]